jgi:hypothetical protein
MEGIKVESYRDCVWYLKDTDKCKLPKYDGSLHSECYCKDKELHEACILITKLLKSDPIKVEDEKADICLEEGDVDKLEDSWVKKFLNRLTKD